MFGIFQVSQGKHEAIDNARHAMGKGKQKILLLFFFLCLPPSRVFGTPRWLRACLRSPEKRGKRMLIMQAKKYQISYTSYLCKVYNSVKGRQSSVPQVSASRIFSLIFLKIFICICCKAVSCYL